MKEAPSEAAAVAIDPAPVGYQPGKYGRFILSRNFGVLAAALSLAVVLIYVFGATPYTEFVFSDMRTYWDRAMARMQGEVFSDAQFIAWPPVYHILLAEFFEILQWAGLGEWVRLETALGINILTFAGSVFALQRLAAHWFRRPAFVLLTVLFYGFGFPALYFNAFLLSGNLGAPLLVIALSVAAGRYSWGALVFAALTFGLATIVRPSLGPYGLSFVLLYLCRYYRGGFWRTAFSLPFLTRAAAFTVVFFAVVFAASAEVSRISGGRVNGLSANGGLDFFIANTDYHRVDLSYDGWHFFVVIPSMSWKPEQGIFYTNVPFYEQDHYLQLGLQAIERNPMGLLTNTVYIKNLFFADMLPSRYDAPGFGWLMPLWDWLKFGMFASLGMYYWARRQLYAEDTDGLGKSSLPSQRAIFTMLVSMLWLTAIVAFLFTGEPRYTYEIIAVFYLLFFKLVEIGWQDRHYWFWLFVRYLGMLAIGAALVWGLVRTLQPDYPPTVAISVEPRDAQTPAPALGQPGGPQPTMVAGRLVFPYLHGAGPLRQAEGQALPTNEPALVRMRARMEVLGDEPLRVTFRVYSSWPMMLFVDGSMFTSHAEPDYFQGAESSATLAPGFHDVELAVQYEPHEGGIALNYSYTGRDEWNVRRALGVDSTRVRFVRLTPGGEPENKTTTGAQP